jgi:hypothetical protein
MSAYPTIEGWEVPEPSEPMSALEWARERLANTTRIAAEKTGADRASWLEDEAYWRDVVAKLDGTQMLSALRATFTNEVIRAIGALARQQNVCREQGGQVVFVTGMEAAQEYIVEHVQLALTVSGRQ